jgi:DNA-binding CsgD family transcriptional regulator
MTSTSSDAIFDALESSLDALLRSASASDFCRALVYSPISGSVTLQGCQLFLLDNSGHLSVIAGYGRAYVDDSNVISAWEDSPLAESVRTKVTVFEAGSGSQAGIAAIPLLRESVPVGCLSLTLPGGVTAVPFHDRIIPFLSKLGTYCLLSLSHQQTKQIERAPNGEELTNRQIEILEFISEGLVNAEIAVKLMLSESTIRQETVRIYRALGVPNRSEAAKKGRALGLIKRASIAN